MASSVLRISLDNVLLMEDAKCFVAMKRVKLPTVAAYAILKQQKLIFLAKMMF